MTVSTFAPPAFADEAELQAYCVAYAIRLEWLCWLVKRTNTRGVPDLYMAFFGSVSVWVEFKHPNGRGRVSMLQRRRLMELKERGIPAYVCASFEHFRTILANHYRSRPDGTKKDTH